MIKLTVLYPNEPGAHFDKEYYVKEHFDLLHDLLGDAIMDTDINFGMTGATPDDPAPYVVIANIIFESMESFQNAFGPHAKKIAADVKNYTNIKSKIQLSEVAGS